MLAREESEVPVLLDDGLGLVARDARGTCGEDVVGGEVGDGETRSGEGAEARNGDCVLDDARCWN